MVNNFAEARCLAYIGLAELMSGSSLAIEAMANVDSVEPKLGLVSVGIVGAADGIRRVHSAMTCAYEIGIIEGICSADDNTDL